MFPTFLITHFHIPDNSSALIQQKQFPHIHYSTSLCLTLATCPRALAQMVRDPGKNKEERGEGAPLRRCDCDGCKSAGVVLESYLCSGILRISVRRLGGV